MTADPTQLAVLLRAAHAALLAGDYERLAALTAETEAALTQPLPQDETALTQIRALALENVALTEAAKRGVATARGRGEDSRFSTYNDRGERATKTDQQPAKPLRL